MKEKRFVGIILLIILLFILLLYSHFEFYNHDYSDSGYIFENFQMFNNTEVTLKAKVKEVQIMNQTIMANIGDSPYYLIKIQSNTIESRLQKGNIIFVIGIVTGNRSITAERIFVHNPWMDYYIFLISIPAVPFVLYLFYRTWWFDRKNFIFKRRKKDA